MRNTGSGFSGLISFMLTSLISLKSEGLSSLLQHRSSEASVLWHSAFFMLRVSHRYVTTGKTIALTIGIFVSKVMSLLFNMLYRFVIAFLLRSKHLLITCLIGPKWVIQKYLVAREVEKSNIWIRVTALSRLDKTSHDSPLLAGNIAVLKQIGKNAVKKVLGR